MSVSWLGAALRVEMSTEEGYPLTALFQRSHPMADRLSAGDSVRAWPPCGEPFSPIRSGPMSPNISCEVSMSEMRRYLPVFHDVLGASVLVVGAGTVGTRKVDALLAGGARVTVVAREFSPALEERAARGDLMSSGPYRADLMDGMDIVFAASCDRALNRRVSTEARKRRIPVNVADSPADCSFILPAVVRGEDFTAAISTGGRHPGAANAPCGNSWKSTGPRWPCGWSGGGGGRGSRRGKGWSISSAPGRATRTC